MIRLKEMAEFVNDHVFQAFGRIECKADVEADATRFGLAAAPAALHVAICDGLRMHIKNSCPLLNEWRNTALHYRTPRFDLFLACCLGTC